MSFASIPGLDGVQNGDTIDAPALLAVFQYVNNAARAFAGDILGGRSVWLDGGSLNTDNVRGEIQANIEPMTGYVVERVAIDGTTVGLALRVSVPAMTATVPSLDESALVLVPHNQSEFFASLLASPKKLAHLLPRAYAESPINPVHPVGEVLPVAAVETGVRDVVSEVDMRMHPVMGVVVDGGGSVKSKRDWVQITDMRVAVYVNRGDEILVRFEGDLTDAFTDFGEKGTNIGKDPRGDRKLIFNGEVVLSTNSTIAPGQPTAMVIADWPPVGHTIFAEWIYTPDSADYENGTDPGYGVVVLQLSMRGFDFSISDAFLFVQIRPAEMAP